MKVINYITKDCFKTDKIYKQYLKLLKIEKENKLILFKKK